MAVKNLVIGLFLFFVLAGPAAGQSGAARTRIQAGAYGVNLKFAVYQYDSTRSPDVGAVTRLTQSFSSADEETAYLKEKQNLQEVALRHQRSVGLASGETFGDAVLLGPEYMVLAVTPAGVQHGHMKLDLRVRYANEALLEASNVDFDNFETVLLRGGRGMFGVKYFIGAGGRQESAPMERTLLVSVTPEIVPATGLRNRPEELSHPVDEYGAAIRLKEGDRFTPPVALDRLVPKFEAGKAVRGSVLLAGVVTAEGKITNVSVIRSLESEIDQRAIEAFRQYKFSPALLNGKPVNATYREELTFAGPPPSLREIQEEMDKTNPKPKRRRRPFPLACATPSPISEPGRG